MNERVKAILVTALKLSPEERAELAQTLLDTLTPDAAGPDLVLADDASSGADDGGPQRHTSDVLAKYLDI